MDIIIATKKGEPGIMAAKKGAEIINEAIRKRGEAFVIMATGVSQFEMLDCLVKEDVDWSKVTAFHLDEYIGLPATHPASFRKYLSDRFASRIALKKFNYIQGDSEPQSECKRLGDLISKLNVDVAFTGIGENGHLAFNDPPADFDTEDPYIVVQLDDVCRKQQLGEGWFPTIDDVPDRAISMSIKQILKSAAIICIAPEKRKAEAVRNTVESDVSPMFPASILRTHPLTWLFLDEDSASLLKR